MALTITQWKNTGLLPTSGQLAWHQYEPSVSGDFIIYDYSGNTRHIQCTPGPNQPVLHTDVIDGQPGWYFSGTSDPLFFLGSNTPKHVFILASADEATFPDYRGLLSGVTSGTILVSDTTPFDRFFDAGLGAGFVYRKDDVLWPNNNMKAPMSGAFGLMEVQMPSGIALDGIQVGKQLALARKWKGYFIEQIIYNRVLTTAERMRVKLYFNLKYSQWQRGLPLYFPSDDFINIKRRRFYAEPPAYSEITDSYQFEDGGKTFNEVGDTPPLRWEYNYQLVNSNGSTDPPEVKIFDEFNNIARLINPFNFTDKYGTVWENVRIESYDRFHEKHMPWRQDVRFKLVKYPG